MALVNIDNNDNSENYGIENSDASDDNNEIILMIMTIIIIIN